MLVFVVIARTEPTYYPDKLKEPTGVYAMRFLHENDASHKSVDNLMTAMCKQIKSRFEGHEDLTVLRMLERFDIQVFTTAKSTPSSGKMKTWPFFLGHVWREGPGRWYW